MQKLCTTSLLEAKNRLRSSAQSLEESIANNQAAIASALNILETWFNTTQNSALAKRVPSAVKTLVDVFGYVPYTGRVYRNFRYTKTPLPKVGDVVKCTTGLRPVQSWSGTESAAIGFSGNSHNSVVGELLSDELQLLNTRWLRTCLKQLTLTAKRRGLPRLRAACAELGKTIRPAGHRDDEDEVIMMIPAEATIRVRKVIPKFKLL